MTSLRKQETFQPVTLDHVLPWLPRPSRLLQRRQVPPKTAVPKRKLEIKWENLLIKLYNSCTASQLQQSGHR